MVSEIRVFKRRRRRTPMAIPIYTVLQYRTMIYIYIDSTQAVRLGGLAGCIVHVWVLESDS